MPSKQPTGNKPVVIPVAADQLDLLQLHRSNPRRYPYLLQSVAQPAGQASFDILFACPQYALELSADGTQKIKTDFTDIDNSQNTFINQIDTSTRDFLETFKMLWQLAGNGWSGDSGLPFSGGWFVYLGYELSKQIEPVLQSGKNNGVDFPTAIASRVPAAIIRSHDDNQFFFIVEENYQELSDLIQRDLQSYITSSAYDKENNTGDSIIVSILEDEAQEYIDNVKRIKEYIRDGDVFQVNLSRLWQATLHADISTAQIYSRLSQTNPAPFFALAEYGDNAIISSSPERLVKVNGRRIDTRPIAGTRPRGNTRDSDQANLDELIDHPKERAEHIMLIDLERNDLGRVCLPGSVKVNELMVLESYSHVHHIVSNVQGCLREEITPSDVIKAVFPGGTITGCPKVRCMEIIAELEKTDRGPYTGSLGYVNHSGDMDLNILIRTLVKQKNRLSFRAGAGIVADSIPENELEETRAKAKGLLLAL